MLSKIAVVTQDNQKVSAHFGMAPFYRVFSIENGQIVGEETRQKPHHEQHPDQNASHQHEQGHGPGHHNEMFTPIADCQVLICGGMGTPAYAKAQAAGLEVILAGGEIRAAMQAYLCAELVSDPRRVHAH
jgi:predicted Fe-Mo cluster-binding NifX family protein